MTTVTRDQFEIQGNVVAHVPTGARFTVGSDFVNWGRAGDVLPDGDDFERKDILHIAIQIMRDIRAKSDEALEGAAQMTSTLALQQAIRNFLAQVPSGERIETLALATTLLAQLDDRTAIEDARAIIRREATALGVEWWDEK
jgi:hypothetical protein